MARSKKSARVRAAAQQSAPNAPAATVLAVQPPDPDSVVAEIPVIVHASHRFAAHGEKSASQPVREETRTAFISLRGAAVHLSAVLFEGELVVLTNGQTRSDVLCRVVRTTEQPGAQNFVQLEFTRAVAGFWDAPAAATERDDAGAATCNFPIVEPEALRSASADLPAVSARTTGPFLVRPSANDSTDSAASPSAAASPVVSSVAKADDSIADVVMLSEPERSAEAGVSLLTRLQKGVRDLVAELALDSGKGLWVAGTCVFATGLVIIGFGISHRRPSTSVAAAGTALPIAAAQPVVASADVPNIGKPSTAEPKTAQQTSAEASLPLPSRATSEDGPGVVEEREAENTQPRRKVIDVHALAAPKLRPRTGSASEPPPLLGEANPSGNLLETGALQPAAPPRVGAPSVPAAESPVRPASGFQAAKVVRSTPPAYPSIARTQGLEGVVVLDVSIDEIGNVTDARVVSGPLMLRQAAIDAVRQWKYQPAELNGVPVASHQTVNLNFTRQ